jgi:hypothetical protein
MNKLIAIILSCLISTSFAQEKTVIGTNAPINVSEEGVGQMEGETLDEAKARRELELSRVKPALSDDGKVKEEKLVQEVKPDDSPDGSLDSSGDPLPKEIAAESAKPEEAVQDVKVVEPAKRKAFAKRKLSKAVFVTTSYQFSKWSKISSKLKDGSMLYGAGMIHSLNDNWELIGSLSFTHGSGDDFSPENMRVLSLKFGGNYLHQFAESMSLLGGLSLLVNDYNIRSVRSRNDQVISYDRYGSGGALGSVVDLGIRAFVTETHSVDVFASYYLYFANELKDGGGPAIGVRVNFGL